MASKAIKEARNQHAQVHFYAVSIAGEIRETQSNKMLVKIIWQILLLCSFHVFEAENAALQVCFERNFQCLCEDRPSYETKHFTFENFNAEAKNCQELWSAVCANRSCSYTPKGKLEDDRQHLAEKRSVSPVKIVLPPLDEEADHPVLRHRRFPKSCNDSISPIKHAVMDCSVWPEFISCEINCTHGYAMMEDGKSMLKTTRKCRETEPTWQPKASFPVCEPYINCKAILVKPGNLDCKTSGPMISYCDLSCEPDEDKTEVPSKRYECLDDNFAKTLPHCATVAEDVNLIPRPQISQGLQNRIQDPQIAPQGLQKATPGLQNAL